MHAVDWTQAAMCVPQLDAAMFAHIIPKEHKSNPGGPYRRWHTWTTEAELRPSRHAHTFQATTHHNHLTNVAIMGGSVHTIAVTIDPQVWSNLIHPDDGNSTIGKY